MFNPEKNSQKINEQDLSLKLETSRFQLSNESLELIKKAREHLTELQKTKSEVMGLGFFGSRMVKNEHDESDLDCLIFYNGNEANNKDEIYRQLRSSLHEINYNDSSPVPYEIPNSIDLSEVGIQKMIKNFNQLVQISKTPGNEEIAFLGKSGKPRGNVWDMVSPFFLSVGDGVYQARMKIFSELEKLDDGDEVWKKIVFFLSYIERDAETKKRESLPKYKFYPQTIEDAKKFFKVL